MEELVRIHAELLGIDRVQGVFRVHEGRKPSELLGLGDHVEGEGGLARRLGAVDLDNPPSGNAPYAGGQVHRKGTGGDDGDVLHTSLFSEAHDGPLPELLMDLGDGDVHRPLPVFYRGFSHGEHSFPDGILKSLIRSFARRPWSLRTRKGMHLSRRSVRLASGVFDDPSPLGLLRDDFL